MYFKESSDTRCMASVVGCVLRPRAQARLVRARIGVRTVWVDGMRESGGRPDLASTNRVDRLFERERTGGREIELEGDGDRRPLHTSRAPRIVRRRETEGERRTRARSQSPGAAVVVAVAPASVVLAIVPALVSSSAPIDCRGHRGKAKKRIPTWRKVPSEGNTVRRLDDQKELSCLLADGNSRERERGRG